MKFALIILNVDHSAGNKFINFYFEVVFFLVSL